MRDDEVAVFGVVAPRLLVSLPLAISSDNESEVCAVRVRGRSGGGIIIDSCPELDERHLVPFGDDFIAGAGLFYPAFNVGFAPDASGKAVVPRRVEVALRLFAYPFGEVARGVIKPVPVG